VLFWYFLLGSLFGAVLTKAEIVSWFRIQEMFRFDSFRMYGIIGSAVAVAALSVAVLRRTSLRAVSGEAISIPAKQLGMAYRYWIGGLLFGVGWALTGACPGPMIALVGAGSSVFVVTVLSALAGTWAYGYLRPHLPHY
jgi:uncharacterized membrane protein YedE/YeeE